MTSFEYNTNLALLLVLLQLLLHLSSALSQLLRLIVLLAALDERTHGGVHFEPLPRAHVHPEAHVLLQNRVAGQLLTTAKDVGL